MLLNLNAFLFASKDLTPFVYRGMLKQEQLSGRYTTDINQIININCR